MKKKDGLSRLLIATVGVVFGDIGTSPLYALKTCLSIPGITINEHSIVGIISLFIWLLVLVVFIKYIFIVLKMDHNGEGGILTLSRFCKFKEKKLKLGVYFLGIIGVALFFGDGVITPALSVLSAVEGITLIDPLFKSYTVPITVILLTVLFSIQKFGSQKIGYFFGPIMILWFLTLLVLGVTNIIKNPLILKALNPYYGVSFLFHHYLLGFSIFSGVVLVVTGAEALYADLGHFGRNAIMLSWTYFVFPSLVVNYLGQGALLLSDSTALSDPFYLMAPTWFVQYLVVLATFATIIASQSILSGIFSITSQSILLNYLPRFRILNTSEHCIGQVYISRINFFIYVLTVLAVVKFGTSQKLAFSYGLCVSCIMLITTILTTLVVLKKLKWNKWKSAFFLLPLLLVDIFFVIGNLGKFLEGAWYALLISLFFFYIIMVWIKGNAALYDQKIVVKKSIEEYIENHLSRFSERIPGVSIFLCSEVDKIPNSLTIHLKHSKFLHQKIIFLTFSVADQPYVKGIDCFKLKELPYDIKQVVYSSGFKEIPSMHKVIHWLQNNSIMDNDFSIYISKGIPIPTKSKYLSVMSEKIYIMLYALSQSPIDFYKIPNEKVIELGVRYKI